MTHEQKVKETAERLYRCAQTIASSPFYSESENIVDRIIERADKAGCPITNRIDLTRGQNRRVCAISFEDAKIVAEYYESYVEPHFTVKFYMKDGSIRIIRNRDRKEVQRLSSKGVLIEAIPE